MLEQLLTEIRKGGTFQPGMLAGRLKLSTAMVEAMLADLERMGMLREVDPGCGEPCGGCPMVSSCSPGDRGRLWMLTSSNTAYDLS